MKVNRKLVIIIIVIILILIGGITLVNNVFVNPNLKYQQEYIVGEGNIKGNVDVAKFKNISEDFDIGANKYGYAVFKNPKKALERLKKEYQKGINLIKTEFNLEDLSHDNYKEYKIYGWQVTTGSSEEQEEARFVTLFMDIYENSFEK